MIRTACNVWGPGYTTENCITMLRKHLKPGMSVLDIGTGTGILALRAKEAGAGRVLAVDCSPAAVALAKENLAGTGVEVRPGALNRGIEERFDIIVANLDATPAMELLQYAAKTMTDHGLLILTWYSGVSWLMIEDYFRIVDQIPGAEYACYALEPIRRTI